MEKFKTQNVSVFSCNFHPVFPITLYVQTWISIPDPSGLKELTNCDLEPWIAASSICLANPVLYKYSTLVTKPSSA